MVTSPFGSSRCSVPLLLPSCPGFLDDRHAGLKEDMMRTQDKSHTLHVLWPGFWAEWSWGKGRAGTLTREPSAWAGSELGDDRGGFPLLRLLSDFLCTPTRSELLPLTLWFWEGVEENLESRPCGRVAKFFSFRDCLASLLTAALGLTTLSSVRLGFGALQRMIEESQWH